MKRREFITLLGGAAAWPLAARAQSHERMRLIGVLAGTTENDPQAQLRIAAFTQALREMGWNEGTNIKLKKRYSAGNPERLPALAIELVQANCAVLVAEAAQAVDAARGATRTIPIVMVYVGDALGPDYVASLAHPGGNITGQTLVATDQAAKRLELMKKLSPDIKRIAVLSNLKASGHVHQRKEMDAAAPKLGVELQDPFAQWNDETHLLRDGDKLSGRDHAPLGMMPPQKCLEGSDLVVLQTDDRLIEQLEFPIGERAS